MSIICVEMMETIDKRERCDTRCVAMRQKIAKCN